MKQFMDQDFLLKAYGALWGPEAGPWNLSVEQKYLEYRSQAVDDHAVYDALRAKWRDRRILLLSPGTSLKKQREAIRAYIEKEKPVCIGINAVSVEYEYDYLFFSN